MNPYTVSFFGHRQIDHLFRLEGALEEVIFCLLGEREKG